MIPNDVILPQAAASAVVADVALFGQRRLETGGFLLAPRGSEQTLIVARCATAGILRRAGLFQVSERALDRLFEYADQHELWIPVQFHSHKLAALLSPCDIEHGLSVEGFVTTIVPYFHAPSADPARWGWWRYRGGWKRASSPETSPTPAHVIVFDEDGVRDA